MKTVLMIVALLAQTPATVPANLIGTWTLDGFRGAAPLGVRHERAICGAALPEASQAGTPDGSSHDVQVGFLGTVDGVIVIAASPGGLLIERKFTGSAGAGTITHTYPLDGSASVAASGDLSVSGKIAVAGSALTVDTTVTRGKGAAQAVCMVRELLEVNSSGMLQVSAYPDAGQATSSVQTYIRKTTSHPINKEIR
jgi:hypothetical protein